MNAYNNTVLYLLVHSHNEANNFKFQGFEKVPFETARLIKNEVVNHELQILLFEVVVKRSYNIKEMEFLIGMTRKFDNRVRRKVYKLIIDNKLHLEILHTMLKIFHRNFNVDGQIKVLKILKYFDLFFLLNK